MSKTEKLCMIVDDLEFDRLMMRRVFAKHCPDIPMIVARDLKEARQRMRERNISILFLDNALPDGMGVDLVQEMAEDDQFKGIPVVIVSDFPSPFMYAKAKAANVLEVWSKRDFIGPAVERVVNTHARV